MATGDGREMEPGGGQPFDERTYRVEVLYREFDRGGTLRDFIQEGAVSAYSPEHAAMVTFLAWNQQGHKRIRVRIPEAGQEWDISLVGQPSRQELDHIREATDGSEKRKPARNSGGRSPVQLDVTGGLPDTHGDNGEDEIERARRN